MTLKIEGGFDGACEPVNPGGVASWGFWIDAIENRRRRKVNEGSGISAKGPKATNNVAEYDACEKLFRSALEFVKGLDGRSCTLTVVGDSQLVVNQVLGSWRIRAPHLRPRVERIRKLLEELDELKCTVWLKWVPREKNDRADELSKRAYEEETGREAPKDNEHHKRRQRRA